METELLSASDPSAIDRALGVLETGGLVAFPTDTVYGLGALVFNDAAVRGIYVAKGREPEKAIPVLLADPGALELVTDHVEPLARRLADTFWPGAITLVVEKNAWVPDSVSASATVGVRVPNHVVARRLLQRAGPMAVTSANVSGQANPSSAQEVATQLTGRVALILDGGQTPGGIPSTVVDCTGAEPIILRAGPISLEEIRRALRET